ncbi:hypothetical protein NL676_019242 [Syzygium grande]|nr:hypothetical protein NL676_019242 [Syzygium grande]
MTAADGSQSQAGGNRDDAALSSAGMQVKGRNRGEAGRRVKARGRGGGSQQKKQPQANRRGRSVKKKPIGERERLKRESGSNLS